MTQADLIEKVYSKVGFSREEVAQLVEELLELMKETL